MEDDLLLQRESERQEFLNKVKRFMMDHEEESNSQSGRLKAQIGWLIAIGDLFTKVEKLPPIKNVLTAGKYQTEITIFRTKVMVDIMRFSRTEEETILMVGQLFAWVSKSLVMSSRVPYQVQMADNPELILREETAE